MWWRRRRKASRFSVDIRQVLVVPVEVSTSVDPILGTCVWIGAHLEPPKKINTGYISVGIYYGFGLKCVTSF